MKKYFYFTFILLFLISPPVKSQVNKGVKPSDTINFTDASGVKTGYWEEKTLEVMNKGFYIQNKKEGSWVGFYPNNIVARVEFFKTGKKDGPCIQLDRRGKITSFESYRNGLLNGQQLVYAATGDFPISETNYLNGAKNGVCRQYYDNGKPQEESNYLNNEKEGVSRWFSKTGKTMVEYNYKSGSFEGPQKTFYDNDTIQILSNYTKNELAGQYKEFYRNGKPKVTGKYVNGLKDGPWTEYDETGKAVKVTKNKAGNAPK
ncbi:MAG: hypothetical protein NTX43_00180 [Bacteroidetes bacterium]|nr:hypothetical protein [Bacteroidota bacterium]